MRLRRRLAFGPLLLLAPFSTLVPVSSAISLSQFQQIYGFSAACTAAYNTDIPGCTASDFTANNPCSINCISGLEVITALLNSACQGIEADPKTLIGLFFEGNGVSALCPNVDSGSTQQSSAGAQSGGNSMTTTTITSTLVQTLPSAISSVASSTTPTSSSNRPNPTISTTTMSPTLGSSATATVTQTTIETSYSSQSSRTTLSSISVSPSPSSVASLAASISNLATQTGSGFTKTAVDDGTAVVITSKPEQTSSNNPDAFGGGGSPFEISNQSTNVMDNVWMMYGSLLSLAVWWIF